MSINLKISLDTPPLSWRKFIKTYPPYAMALDGFVNEAPCYDETGPRINFNHHENVDRLATRSTCAQVLIAIRQGLFDYFKDENGPRADVYVNDCDEDICLSWYLLKNFRLVKNGLPPSINRLVVIEDLMDATAGAYPLPIDLSTLQEIAWIFEPYRTFRIKGGLDRKNTNEFEEVVGMVTDCIEKYVEGCGESIPLDVRYKKIGGGPNWVMIEETGSHARTGAYNDGIRAYAAVRKSADNRWVYTIGKMSPFTPFNVSQIIKALNKAEGCKQDNWGGANTIGGSPRVHGSKLSPKEVEKIINGLASSSRTSQGHR